MTLEEALTYHLARGSMQVFEDGRILGAKGQIIGTTHENGYVKVGVWDPVERRPHVNGAHKIVWIVFRGSVPAGYEVNHKDGDKSNNSLDNLELCSRSENMKHAYNTGLSGGGRGVVKRKSRAELVKIIRESEILMEAAKELVFVSNLGGSKRYLELCQKIADFRKRASHESVRE